jgi:hypothetical protein
MPTLTIAVLPWDAFIHVEAEGAGISDERKDAFVERQRLAVERFRTHDWKRIKREMRTDWGWLVPDSMEPHWTSPGHVVYWKQQTKTRAEQRVREGRRESLVIIEEKTDWKPTNPLPAANASQIVYYLKKGLRLRPPVEEGEEDVVELSENALPSEELQGVPDEKEPHKFICNRHGQRGAYGFNTWKAYRYHCLRYGEPVNLEMPADIQVRSRKHAYYCPEHDWGSDDPQIVRDHFRMKSRPQGPVRAPHRTIEQMLVAQEKSDVESGDRGRERAAQGDDS